LSLLLRLPLSLSLTVHIREVCVLTAPFFTVNTTLVAYAFSREIWDSRARLVAAALIAICLGYISRSVAGSYDNEGVAIRACAACHLEVLKVSVFKNSTGLKKIGPG
jgi:dolichyl-diphosphooligosaccharide---protein glycosyltransferase